MLPRQVSFIVRPATRHFLYSSESSSKLSQTGASPEPISPNTHYRITLLRSAIALPKRYKETLVSLGIHRRMQTVYHPHRPDIAGKILKVKELVEVQNVPASSVRTKTEQRRERRPDQGFEVVKTLRDKMW